MVLIVVHAISFCLRYLPLLSFLLFGFLYFYLYVYMSLYMRVYGGQSAAQTFVLS